MRKTSTYEKMVIYSHLFHRIRCFGLTFDPDESEKSRLSAWTLYRYKRSTTTFDWKVPGNFLPQKPSRPPETAFPFSILISFFPVYLSHQP